MQSREIALGVTSIEMVLKAVKDYQRTKGGGIDRKEKGFKERASRMF